MSATTQGDNAPGITSAKAAKTRVTRSKRATPFRFADLLALDDFQQHARRHLPRLIYQYIAGSVETGAAQRAASAAYARYELHPRMMVDTAARDQSVTLLGRTWRAPFGVPPLGGAALAAYRGDLVLAEAAARMGVPMAVSASALISLEDVIARNPDAWFQAYLAGDQPRIDRMVDRVAAAGYRTLVVTVDTPVLGNREHDIRSGYSLPIRVTPKVVLDSALHPAWLLGTLARTWARHGAPHLENTEAERGPPILSRAVVNTTARDQLSWRHLDAIRARWRGHLLVKGLVTAADAIRARDCGADGVVLSSHGGRQLDCAPAPLDALVELGQEKRGMAVIVDSGIRRGTDVIKALALGADFVLVGRPLLFAAAIGGVPGVLHAMTILRDEIHRDMALMGVNRLAELTPDFVRRVPGAA